MVTGRLAATWCCTRAVPPARADGLGALVAGSVPDARRARGHVAGVLAGAAVLGLLDDDGALRIGLALVAALLVGLAVAAVVLLRSARRFGGVTGDVMGAVVEIATAAVLVRRRWRSEHDSASHIARRTAAMWRTSRRRRPDPRPAPSPADVRPRLDRHGAARTAGNRTASWSGRPRDDGS